MTVSVSENEVAEKVHGIPLVDLPQYVRKEVVTDDVDTVEEKEINFTLLGEILEYIKNHPLTWEQEAWFRIVDLNTGHIRYESEVQNVQEINSCGAAFCFAGHVALAEGFPAPPKDNNHNWERKIFKKDDRETWTEYEGVDDFARKRLGLTYDQAGVLFGSGNSIEDLEVIIEALRVNPKLDDWELEAIIAHSGPEDFREYMEKNGFLE